MKFRIPSLHYYTMSLPRFPIPACTIYLFKFFSIRYFSEMIRHRGVSFYQNIIYLELENIHLLLCNDTQDWIWLFFTIFIKKIIIELIAAAILKVWRFYDMWDLMKYLNPKVSILKRLEQNYVQRGQSLPKMTLVQLLDLRVADWLL